MTTPIDLVADSPAITGDSGYSIELMNGTSWEGILAVESVTTGDGREFAENAITWADVPLPLRRNIEDSHGGTPTTRTVLVGRIDEVYRDPMNPLEIRGRGVFDDAGEHGAEAVRLVQGKFLKGISVDPDDIADADVELIFPESDKEVSEDEDLLMDMFMSPEKTIFHAGRIRAATLVDIPAFVEAQIWLMSDAQAVPVSSDDKTPMTHYAQLSDQMWNGPQQEKRLMSHNLTVTRARVAFAHVDNGTPTSISTRFLHHEIADDGHVGLPNFTACSASLRAINAGRAETLTERERRVAYDHLAQHLTSAGIIPPPYAGQVVTAAALSDLPPATWFSDPGLTTVTPFTVTDEITAGGWRRVYGHGAPWNSCHTSFSDVCTSPPHEGEHSYFRVGEVSCVEGHRVPIGTITLGTGHAPLRNITSSQAMEHYDNTGTVVAMVASGEDHNGIWVAGAIPPGVPESRVVTLQASALSGDWRRIGGKLRLIAFLAVNHPGFPIARTQTFTSQQKQLALVAAGVITQDMRRITLTDPRPTLERIAKSIGRDRDARIAALRARVKG